MKKEEKEGKKETHNVRYKSEKEKSIGKRLVCTQEK
jgi:hypothetical protein